jgi:hypothetical protein
LPPVAHWLLTALMLLTLVLILIASRLSPGALRSQ